MDDYKVCERVAWWGSSLHRLMGQSFLVTFWVLKIKLNVPRNFLESFVKHRFLALNPRDCVSRGLSWGLRSCIFSKLPGDADVAGLGSFVVGGGAGGSCLFVFLSSNTQENPQGRPWASGKSAILVKSWAALHDQTTTYIQHNAPVTAVLTEHFQMPLLDGAPNERTRIFRTIC